MNEEPTNSGKKSWATAGWFHAWLILVAVTFVVILIVTQFLPGGPRSVNDWTIALTVFFLASMVIAAVFIGLWKFVRWLCCWRNFKRFLFGVVCFITLIALLVAEEDWRGWHAWNQFKTKWEVKGERFDWASIVPPTVPDEQNFAMAPIWVESMKAQLGPKNSRQWFGDKYADENGSTNFLYRLNFDISHNENSSSSDAKQPAPAVWQKGQLTDLIEWQHYYRTVTGTNDFPMAPQPQSAAADVLLALSKFDSSIAELKGGAERPYSRFPVYNDERSPFDTLLPHLAPLKGCAQVLKMRAIAELQSGQSTNALNDLKLSLRLIDSVRSEPYLISHLVRIAVLQITLQPVYEGLAKHNWSDAQLVELDEELAKYNFLADYQLAMGGERVCAVLSIESMRRNREIIVSDSQGVAKMIKLTHAIPSAFFYQNELSVAKANLEYAMPMADVEKLIISPTQVRQLQKQSEEYFNHHPWPYKILGKMVFPAIQNAVKKFAYCQATVDLARVAIALERYRLAHGEYPETLDTLAPQFMTKVPHDVINGGPLHYRRETNGSFTLYSIGWNETDDGGVVVTKKGETPTVDISQGDWVWRYPR